MATVYEIVTQRITEQLERGTIPWKQPWLGGDAGLPRNLVSGKAYRGINTLLLGSLGHATPDFLTFKQAQALGGSVKKGSHGFPIVFWKI